MEDNLLSDETKAELLRNTEFEIIEKTKSIDETRNYLIAIDKTFGLLQERNTDLENIERLLEFRLLIGLLILDLTTSTRIYLNAKYKYEGLYSIRQIIVIINEGYKKIYNFKKTNSNGDEIIRDRKKSFWIQDIGTIIENDLFELNGKYSELTNELEIYFENNFNDIKGQRDLSIHYDRKPTKVYDMLTKLNIESTFKKLIPFFQILNNMFDFTHDILMSFNDQANSKKECNLMSLERMISNIENVKSLFNEKDVKDLKESLINIKNLNLINKSTNT